MTEVQRKVSPASHQRRKGKSSRRSMLMATDEEEQNQKHLGFYSHLMPDMWTSVSLRHH